jgi:hypothetical protein
MTDMLEADIKDLTHAKSLLESPGFASKITHFLGAPIEKGFAKLPAKWTDTINKTARISLEKALHAALFTLGTRKRQPASEEFHRILVSASGAGGGAFGLPALALEMPISTTIMLRSIADIARSEGESLDDPLVKLECIEVFALGGPSRADDASETGYFGIRAALARAVSEAAKHVAGKGVAQESAPVLVRLISQIATRFGVVVSEKAAAQAVPIIGAAGGALINSLFMSHFQDMARGHFIVRRLEKKYGAETVKKLYRKI